MDGADQASVLVLRPCSYATECDQEAYDKKGPAETVWVIHGDEVIDPDLNFGQFTINDP